MKVTATISIDHQVKSDGQAQAKEKGHKSFSEYIEHLIKEDGRKRTTESHSGSEGG
jgi:predicted CopG family antitoxin